VRDAFGLIVRTVGLVLTVIGLIGLFVVVGLLLKLPVPLPARYSLASEAIVTTLYLVSGVVILLTAKLIVRVVYGHER
jgi:hypothetical protein